jgi:hypothetical protein
MKNREADSSTMNRSAFDLGTRARRPRGLCPRQVGVARKLQGARILFGTFVLCILTSIPAHSELIGVAHRGGRTQGPEATLEVFQLSIDLGVTPWLETDTWVSADGVLMIHHDLDLCRTTDIATFPGYDCVVPANNPKGRFPRVADFTAAFLKTLDVGSWFSPAFVGTRMPTLEEAIALVDGTGVPLLIEVKHPGQAARILEILTRTGLSVDNIIIWARQRFAYDEYNGVIPGIRQVTGILPLREVTDAFLAARAAVGDFGIGMIAVGLTQELVDKIHSYGLLTYSIPGPTGQDSILLQIPLGIDGFHVTDELGWQAFLATIPCADRVDNDADGFADFGGIDLDFDGTNEIPADVGCTERMATTEIGECQDLVDNDGDTFVDLADPACLTANSITETSPRVPSLSRLGFLLLGLSVLSLGLVYSRRPLAARVLSWQRSRS